MSGVVKKVEPLSFPFQTPDPFLFAVYHNDAYPAGEPTAGSSLERGIVAVRTCPSTHASMHNLLSYFRNKHVRPPRSHPSSSGVGDEKMQAPRKGDGADFNPNAPYRMYHGDRVPGFPQHPHRGFETITCTMRGVVDHTDSLGNAGRYGHGDVQWMTAGKGIVHGEMFPLVNSDRPNDLQLFQIWINLPAARKMTAPAFTMHWAPNVQSVRSDDGKTTAVVWAGELMGARGQPPPPMSWAADPTNDVAVWFLTMKPGASFSLPPAGLGAMSNRTLYFFEGDGLSVSGRALTGQKAVELDAGQTADLTVPEGAGQDTLVLILQGKPIGEPVAQHGPFVMNTRQEIMQAFMDYQQTQFGGWPWPEDSVVFPRDKGRFALMNGKEERPPVGEGHDEL